MIPREVGEISASCLAAPGVVRLLFHGGRKGVFHEVAVSIPTPDTPRGDLFFKIEEALGILAQWAPHHLKRLRRCSAGIIVFGQEGADGEWHRAARLVKLSERYVASRETRAAHVAATIVHEATHAWLDHRGIRYIPERRRRIEAMCYRAEARFASRLPDGGELSALYSTRAQRVLAGTDEQWSDAAFRERRIDDLVALETPGWVLRVFGIRRDELTRARQGRSMDQKGRTEEADSNGTAHDP